ncbi:MAG: EipB family protein, partial [Geminicoccaceae bacterium]
MTRAQALTVAFAVLGTGSSALAQATVAPAGLEPHLAAYRLGLHGTQGAGPLVEVRGGLVIEWRLECDGWISRQRLGFVAATDEGGNINHDIRFTGWETTDGSRMRYAVRSFENDQLLEEYRGRAELEPDDGGVAEFTAPSEQTVRLPPGTV